MLKKLIITLTIITLNLFATNNLELYYDTDYNTIGVVPIEAEIIDENSDDWVGIYKKDASNDWDNVIKWSWVKELDVWHDQQNERYIKVYNFNGLDEGSYEVRYFLNNSYTTYRSHSFDIGKDGGGEATLSITSQTDTTLTLDSTYENDQQWNSWIGIYKKGDSNDWENVKAWRWITKSENSFNISRLEMGTYEARLFYNNSYNLEKKVEFTVEEYNDANIEITDQTQSTLTLNSTYKGDQSWIGVYKKGDSNDWENVKSWSWVLHGYTRLDIAHFAEGTYEARLFYSNSYNLEYKIEFQVEDYEGKITREELDAMIANGEDYSQVDVSGIKNMSGLFTVKAVEFDITGWDVSNVILMKHMFSHAKAFNQPIGDWDVSSVIDMRWMFNAAKAFNQPIGDWDVSNVTDMSSMFSNANSFNQPIGDWDVSSVTSMSYMFSDADAFNQPIGDWDVSSVRSMEGMFFGADAFNQNISSWDVGNVMNSSTFSHYSPLQEDYKPNFND